jgi:hypothetical protein
MEMGFDCEKIFIVGVLTFEKTKQVYFFLNNVINGLGAEN